MIISTIVPQKVIDLHKNWVHESCEGPLFHTLSIAAENASCDERELEGDLEWVRMWLCMNENLCVDHCLRQYGDLKDSTEWNKEG